MRLFLASALTDRYNGAFTLRFGRLSGGESEVNFLYALDNQGFRLEYIPYTSLDGTVVSRRASSPLVLYFFKVEQQVLTPPEYNPQQEWDYAPLDTSPLDNTLFDFAPLEYDYYDYSLPDFSFTFDDFLN
jgi:hypothetical protein